MPFSLQYLGRALITFQFLLFGLKNLQHPIHFSFLLYCQLTELSAWCARIQEIVNIPSVFNSAYVHKYVCVDTHIHTLTYTSVCKKCKHGCMHISIHIHIYTSTLYTYTVYTGRKSTANKVTVTGCICTSYYTSTVQYYFYCSSLEGAKRLRASAVSKAILYSGRVVTSLSPILESEPPPEAGR